MLQTEISSTFYSLLFLRSYFNEIVLSPNYYSYLLKVETVTKRNFPNVARPDVDFS